MMKKIILIGRSGSGKTTLIQSLYNLPLLYKKTQMVEYYPDMIDTPGEYIENKRLLRALIVSSTDCELICLLQDSTDHESIYPPNFTQLFSKPCIGIISKIDMGYPHISQAAEALSAAGVEKIFYISALTGEGIEELSGYLHLSKK